MARQYAAIPVRYDGGRGQMPLRDPDPFSGIYQALQELCQDTEAAAREGLESIAAAFSGDDRFENRPYHEKGGHAERTDYHDRRKGGHRAYRKEKERQHQKKRKGRGDNRLW